MITKEVITIIIWIVIFAFVIAAPYIIVYIGPTIVRWTDKHPVITETVLICMLIFIILGCINPFSDGKLVKGIINE